MIIEQKPFDTVTQGIDESEINYAIIESNPIIMDILSNKMYKNKIGTICREILSNAKDACLEAGVKTPIEVHIPTTYEPWFLIKDFGVGMSEHDVVNIFGNYGRSTKRDSNLSIGGFGLGGKTPFIYNNQFTVTSVKDGKKCVYQFFKNNKGMPVNTRLDSCDTTEPNSVEIRIAANNSPDFRTFENEISYYAKWLDYPIKCNKHLNVDRPKFEMQDGFGLSESNQGQTFVIVGGIPYPVNFPALVIPSSYNGIYGVNQNYLIFFAKIGEVDLISSREEVEYTDKTIQYLKNTTNKVKLFYEKYKLDKTQVWMISNRKAWETSNSTTIRYGFPIKYRAYKWTDGIDAEGVFRKYILLSDFSKVLPYGAICKRIKEPMSSVAFLDKKNKDSLIKIGVDPATIIDYDSLPKQKRGKLPEHKVIDYVNGVIKRHRTNDLKAKVIHVPSDYNLSSNKNIIRKLLDNHKDLSIVVDNSGKNTVIDFIKNNYKPKFNTSYCAICNYLERLGYITKVSKPMTYESDDVLREHAQLITGEQVKLQDSFPLLKSSIGLYDPTEKLHAMKYIEWVINKANSKALNNKHIKVIATKLTKDDETF